MPGFYPLRVSKRGHPISVVFLGKKLRLDGAAASMLGMWIKTCPLALYELHLSHNEIDTEGAQFREDVQKLIAVMKQDKFKGLYGSSVKNNCLCWRSSGKTWNLGSEVEYQPWNLIMKWLRITIRNQLVWDQRKSSQNQSKSLWQQALFFRVQNHQTHCLP